MSQNPIVPEKITKPIQLLGAWLAGLFAIDSCFLFAATKMVSGSIEAIALVIAAIFNVPIFLAAVFLLQTKFRPELQEDSYYSTYLSQKTNQPITIEKEAALVDEVMKRIEMLETKAIELRTAQGAQADALPPLVFGVNRHLEDGDKIKAQLAKHGVLSCTSFGGKEPPKDRVVSISQYLPATVREQVIKIAIELGFKYYRNYDNQLEEALEDVLLGSYGGPEYELLSETSA